MPVLTGRNAPRGKALAIAHAVDVVDDRYFGAARRKEIGVQGMWRADLDRAHRSHQSLPDNLAAKDTLPANLRRTAAEKVHFQRFEIEDVEQILHCRKHEGRPQ